MPEHLLRRAREARERAEGVADALDELSLVRERARIARDTDTARTGATASMLQVLTARNAALRGDVAMLQAQLAQAQQELAELKRMSPPRRSTTVMATGAPMPKRRQSSWWRKLLR